jgi:hypothetical protein
MQLVSGHSKDSFAALQDRLFTTLRMTRFGGMVGRCVGPTWQGWSRVCHWFRNWRGSGWRWWFDRDMEV